MKFRKALVQDISKIDALLQGAQLPIEGYKDFLENFMVCEKQGTLIGVAGFENYGQIGLVRSFAVAPDFRGTGIGRNLYEKVESEAVQKQLQMLYLLTETASAFFQKFGYEIIDRQTAPKEIRMTSEFQELCPDSAKLMRLVLKPDQQ